MEDYIAPFCRSRKRFSVGNVTAYLLNAKSIKLPIPLLSSLLYTWDTCFLKS